MSRELDEDVAEALGSKVRLKILWSLAMSPTGEKSLSAYRLIGLTGQRRAYVEKHLELLVKHGWVKEVPVAGFKNYALNHENPKVAHLVEFFKKIRFV